MDWIKKKWYDSEYKTKFYTFFTAGVAFLFASLFLIANIKFYQNGAELATLARRTDEAIPVESRGIITVIESHPPFQWMGSVPDIAISETELPIQNNGAYVVEGSLEDTCLRLIHAGFLFDTDYSGTTMVSKTKICYLYFNEKTLIAQIEDLEGQHND